MKISRPRSGTLQLSKSRTSAFLSAGFMILFAAFWYSVLLVHESIDEEAAPTLFDLIFWLAPLFMLPEFFRQLRVAMSGETFELNRDKGVIERNGTRVAHFDDVARVQIRVIHDSDGDDQYRLSIVQNSDEKLRIHQSKREDEIADIAEELADILDVEITRKK